MEITSRRSILVIDDSRPVCQYIKRVLEKKGYEVHLAFDGETGVRQAMELLPDLVLLDKELPGLHGFAVSRILRRYQETSFIPILMISSDNSSRERIQGLEMGADDFISKRIPVDELDSKIRAFMRIKDLQDRVLRERDKLNEVFKLLHEPIVICDARDRIVLASHVFLNLFRMPREIAALPDLHGDPDHPGRARRRDPSAGGGNLSGTANVGADRRRRENAHRHVVAHAVGRR